MKKDRKLRAHIVSQTHWDREWYLPFEEFRFHLVRLMDRVLHLFRTQPGYRHFVSDGQTIILEDYLAIRPEREEEIRRHVRSGRLVIGPWYILPDEYIVSGESLVRNLLMGRRVARRFGPISRAGYVPDPFGHVAQLPQILNGFGIDSFIFLRGMPIADKWGTEFFWEAPDRRSTVLAVWMKNIYFNASLLGYEQGWGDCAEFRERFSMDHAMKELAEQLEDLGKWTRRGVILLNNGCDHTPPQFEMPDIVEEANQRFPEADFVHSTYDRFMDDVRKAPGNLRTMRGGELRSSRYIVILPGVLSARMYLKQWNRQCEGLLERQAEPLAAAGMHSGGEDHRGFLVEAWRLLLQNHPHDSICGCSTDAVHREMVTRFEKVTQIGRAVREHFLGRIAASINSYREGATGALLLWNSIPSTRSGPARATVLFPEDFPDEFSIVDGEGNAVPFQAGETVARDTTGYLDFNRNLRERELTLDLPLKGIGYELLHLLPVSSQEREDGWAARATPRAIETDHYRIRFRRNGTLDLLDKATGRTWPNQLLFEDCEDVGDEYDHSHAANGRRLTTAQCAARITITARGPLYVDYTMVIPWKVPAGATADRKGRLRRMVDSTIRVKIRVHRSARRIEAAIQLDNRAGDRRLRVLFDAPRGVEESIADGHFGVITRPADVVTTPKHDGPEPTTHHMRHWVALTDGEAGLAVLNRRLTEYELVKGPRGRRQLAITLMRSVNWLSKDDLLTRPNFAGPMIETPEAQCPGPYETELALLPFGGEDVAGAVVPEAESHASPPEMRFLPSRMGTSPPSRKWITVDRPDVVFSTWKPAEDGAHSILRLYNPDGRKRTVKLTLDREVALIAECDLKEERIGDAPKGGKNVYSISFPGYSIRSFMIGLRGQ